MNKKEHAELEQQLRQAFVRLGAQEGVKLLLPVGQRVSSTGNRRSPISRFAVDHRDTVDVETLEHVGVVVNGAGLCVRLVFDSRLYATSGEEAEKLKLWAEKTGRVTARQRIDAMPEVIFQNVEGRVRIHGGELLPA